MIIPNKSKFNLKNALRPEKIVILFSLFFIFFHLGRYYQYKVETAKVLKLALYYPLGAEKFDTTYNYFPIIQNVKDTMIVNIYYPTFFLIREKK